VFGLQASGFEQGGKHSCLRAGRYLVLLHKGSPTAVLRDTAKLGLKDRTDARFRKTLVNTNRMRHQRLSENGAT